LFLSVYGLGLSCQAIVAGLLLDLIQSGDRMRRLVDFRRLDFSDIKDFSACMCPALRKRDSRLLRVMLTSA
jgi:hypothetical protein